MKISLNTLQKNTTGGTDKPGLVDIAKSAIPPEAGEKRGRGRPPGSGNKSARADSPSAPAIAPAVWNPANVGALVRLPFAGAAWVTEVKGLELAPEEENMILPAAVDVLNLFAPLAAAKYASLVALGAGLVSVGGAKYHIYRSAMKERAEKAKAEREAIAK